ncbi:hypothetical protein TNCV_2266651 [Trichonephila clavipes]|nr:hypothetical protein TNCV_2266651 [Trichonephila clavipes]
MLICSSDYEVLIENFAMILQSHKLFENLSKKKKELLVQQIQNQFGKPRSGHRSTSRDTVFIECSQRRFGCSKKYVDRMSKQMGQVKSKKKVKGEVVLTSEFKRNLV